jgi:hypothetical protein
MVPFAGKLGAYVRLMKIAERHSNSKAQRLEAAFMLIEKAMAESNLE